MIKTNVEGKAIVFRKDKEGMQPMYQVQLSHKNVDGTWENGYIRIQFRKGTEVADRTEIEIKRAWIDFFRTRNNETVFFIKCIDFEVCGDNATGWENAEAEVPF